jgi:hypothetical protein
MKLTKRQLNKLIENFLFEEEGAFDPTKAQPSKIDFNEDLRKDEKYASALTFIQAKPYKIFNGQSETSTFINFCTKELPEAMEKGDVKKAKAAVTSIMKMIQGAKPEGHPDKQKAVNAVLSVQKAISNIAKKLGVSGSKKSTSGKSSAVREIQKIIGASVDGDFGPGTNTAYMNWIEDSEFGLDRKTVIRRLTGIDIGAPSFKDEEGPYRYGPFVDAVNAKGLKKYSKNYPGMLKFLKDVKTKSQDISEKEAVANKAAEGLKSADITGHTFDIKGKLADNTDYDNILVLPNGVGVEFFKGTKSLGALKSSNSKSEAQILKIVKFLKTAEGQKLKRK